MKIYCDSSTKEACFIVDGIDKPVISPYEKQVTNNEGEYLAVITALEAIKDWGYRGVELLTDSMLVVNQVKLREDGGWKCRSSHLLPYIEETRRLILETNAKLSWIPREENLAGKVLG